MFFFKSHSMRVLASLRKATKSGVSTWTFVHDAEMKVFYAVGGEDLKVIPANDRKHLRQIFDNFVRYGYTRKLAKKQPAKPVKVNKQLLVADPWTSELPLQMQLELASL